MEILSHPWLVMKGYWGVDSGSRLTVATQESTKTLRGMWLPTRTVASTWMTSLRK